MYLAYETRLVLDHENMILVHSFNTLSSFIVLLCIGLS